MRAVIKLCFILIGNRGNDYYYSFSLQFQRKTSNLRTNVRYTAESEVVMRWNSETPSNRTIEYSFWFLFSVLRMETISVIAKVALSPVVSNRLLFRENAMLWLRGKSFEQFSAENEIYAKHAWNDTSHSVYRNKGCRHRHHWNISVCRHRMLFSCITFYFVFSDFHATLASLFACLSVRCVCVCARSHSVSASSVALSAPMPEQPTIIIIIVSCSSQHMSIEHWAQPPCLMQCDANNIKDASAMWTTE